MTWLKLTAQALILVDGSAAKDKVDLQQLDPATFALAVPLTWLRAKDAPTAMVIDFGSFTAATPPPAAWKAVYAGLERDGSQLPRNGAGNLTVGGQEPLGSVVQFEGQTFVKGKVSWFGGSQDTGAVDADTAVLTGDRLKSLNDPKDYYCAMRWSFEPNGRRFWANQRILLVNPVNQKAVLVRAIDWGPAVKTGRILNVSQNTLTALEAKTDDELLIAFAKPGNPAIGPL